jgi:putative phage-type endonuclease
MSVAKDADLSSSPERQPAPVPAVGDGTGATTEWLEWRRKGIGASDVAGIVNLSPWASPWSVWADKLGLTPPIESSDAMRFGQLAEQVIGPWFTERTGLELRAVQERRELDGHEWARCTLDAIATSGHLNALVEMKTTSASAAEWDEQIPAQYRLQMAWQSIVTGIDTGYFAVIHMAFGRLQFEVYEHTPEQSDKDWLFEQVSSFWHQHVLTGIPPAADGHQATTDAITATWGHVQADDVLIADNDRAFEMAADELAYARQDRLAAQDREKKAANRVKAFLTDCAVATVDGKPVVSWKPQARSSLDIKRLRDEHPDLAAEYTTEQTIRVLRTHTKKGK